MKYELNLSTKQKRHVRKLFNKFFQEEEPDTKQNEDYKLKESELKKEVINK